MAQLEANREIIAHYGAMAREAEFSGLVAVVSDPVDPLCRAFLEASGLKPCQVQGYGLGVMNARALYYAGKDPRFSRYEKEGRAYGPHGEDLVIADSLEHYDDQLSRELTALTVQANMEVRQLGYKPYIAPALSSAAISILLTLRGQWHYSSLYLGDAETGAFLGIKNQMTGCGPIYEDVPLKEELYLRIRKAYDGLCRIR
jgi:malate/lactate dehydrogenase